MEVISMARTTFAAAAMLFVSWAAFTLPGSAQQLKAGSQLVYDMRFGGNMGGRMMSMTFTFAIRSVNPDGSSNARATISGAGMPSGMGFDTTISPTGAILPKYDPSMKPHTGMGMAEAQKVTENGAAQGLMMNFGPLNGFADACAKRGALHVGDSWTGQFNAPFAVAAVFSVTGEQIQAGHKRYAVSVKSAPGAPGTLAAQGTYDPIAHLVTAFQSSISNNSGQSMTTEVALRS
jgi:hypothetical protein